jgi:hypothetical protein
MNTDEFESRPSPDQEFSGDEGRRSGVDRELLDALHDCGLPSESLALS